MSNIRGLSDIKKDNGRGRGGPQGQGGPGNPPMGGGGGGMFGGIPGLGNLFGGMGGNPSQSHGDDKNIIHIHRDGQLREELVKAGGKLVVIDFTASWCGPCKMIAPHFKEMSDKYTNAVFLKIDVDECQETAQECGIRAMPTFQFYKNSKKVDEFSGASPDKLKAMIEKHIGGSSSSSSSSSSTGSFGGTGYVLGGKSSTSTTNQPTTSSTTNEPTAMQVDDEDVDPILLTNLVEMGFDKEKSEKALRATKAKDIEEAINWIVSHDDETPKPSNPTPAHSTTPSEPTPTSTSTSNEPAPSAPKSTKKLDPNDFMFDDDEEGAVLAAQQAEENKPKRQLTPEEVIEEKRKLEERLRAIRARKAEAEKQEELNREIKRRKEGQEAIESRKKWEDNTKQREAMLKQKEKEDDAQYKAKLKKQLEQDKAERAARAKGTTAPAPAPTTTTAPPASTQPTAKKEYTETAIQIRLPDGNTIKASFKPTDPIRTVHNHIALLTGSSNFSLATTFPRKVYSTKDSVMDTTTLAQAECVPTGTFVVQKS